MAAKKTIGKGNGKTFVDDSVALKILERIPKICDDIVDYTVDEGGDMVSQRYIFETHLYPLIKEFGLPVPPAFQKLADAVDAAHAAAPHAAHAHAHAHVVKE